MSKALHRSTALVKGSLLSDGRTRTLDWYEEGLGWSPLHLLEQYLLLVIDTSIRPVKRIGQGRKPESQASILYTDGEGNNKDMLQCPRNQKAKRRNLLLNYDGRTCGKVEAQVWAKGVLRKRQECNPNQPESSTQICVCNILATPRVLKTIGASIGIMCASAPAACTPADSGKRPAHVRSHCWTRMHAKCVMYKTAHGVS